MFWRIEYFITSFLWFIDPHWSQKSFQDVKTLLIVYLIKYSLTFLHPQMHFLFFVDRRRNFGGERDDVARVESRRGDRDLQANPGRTRPSSGRSSVGSSSLHGQQQQRQQRINDNSVEFEQTNLYQKWVRRPLLNLSLRFIIVFFTTEYIW